LPFREPTLSLPDISEAIAMIERFTLGMDFDAYREDFIRGIGNWLRHQYDRVDVETFYRTVREDLPALKAGVQRALSVTLKPDDTLPL
jgi:uncharacterized protein with HEPN domain